jgi:hypothetical protein
MPANSLRFKPKASVYVHKYESQLFVIHVLKAMVVLVRLYYMAYVTGVTTGARGTGHPPFSNFSNFLFTNLFSIKFLYFFIISSLFPYFNLLVSIFIQSYVNIKLHVSTRSHCVRCPSVVRLLTFYTLIFFLRTTEHNVTKLGMNDP